MKRKLFIISLMFTCQFLFANSNFSMRDISTDTPQTLQHISVENFNNTTTIWITTDNGVKLIFFKHTPVLNPVYDTIEIAMQQNFQMRPANELLGLTYTTTNNDFAKPSYYMVVADLKNNRITPLYSENQLLAYSTQGIAVFIDPKNQNQLLIQPLFGKCKEPMVILLKAQYLKNSNIYMAPVFQDNTHLTLNYAEGSDVDYHDTIIINPIQIYQQCELEMPSNL